MPKISLPFPGHKDKQKPMHFTIRRIVFIGGKQAVQD
jgi:hypothetical protein